MRVNRVGTCGGLLADMKVGDLVLASAASTDSAMNRLRFNNWDHSAAADPEMLFQVWTAARAKGMPISAGEVFASDYFYHPDPDFITKLQAMGILAVDMESAALYALAKQHGRKALTLLAVSDLIATGEKASSEDRQNAFGAVMDIVLGALLKDQ